MGRRKKEISEDPKPKVCHLFFLKKIENLIIITPILESFQNYFKTKEHFMGVNFLSILENFELYIISKNFTFFSIFFSNFEQILKYFLLQKFSIFCDFCKNEREIFEKQIKKFYSSNFQKSLGSSSIFLN